MGFDERMQLGQQRRHLGARNRFTVYLHPFAVSVQMRRGIQPRFQPGGDANGRQHCRHRAFAFGAGDMQFGISCVWIAQQRQKLNDALQAELLWGVPLDAPLFVIHQAIQIPECFMIVHSRSHSKHK